MVSCAKVKMATKIFLIIYTLACVRKSLNLKSFSQISGDYLKNHCTNTRLVCTQFNAFFMLNPNIAMKIQFLEHF